MKRPRQPIKDGGEDVRWAEEVESNKQVWLPRLVTQTQRCCRFHLQHQTKAAATRWDHLRPHLSSTTNVIEKPP